MLNEGRVERLAKRKQWILFNLIQLIYYGKKGHYKAYPIVFAIHFFLSSFSSNIDTCPTRGKHIKLTQMFLPSFVSRVGPWTILAICHRIFISIAVLMKIIFGTVRDVNVNGNRFCIFMSGNYYFWTSNSCRVNRNRSRDFAQPYGNIFNVQHKRDHL